MSARGHFVLYVALLLLPLLAFAGWLAAKYVASERARLEQSVQTSAQQISGEIDRDLTEMLAALHTLSTSRLLAERDFAGFHRQMADARSYIGTDIVLRRPDGQKIADTQVPWGEPLGVFSLPRDQQVLRTKLPAISGVFNDGEARETRYSTIVPIIADGQVFYLLNFNISTKRLLPYLRREHAEFVAASVSDQNGNFVARSSRHEELSGTPGNAEFLNAAAGKREGIWSGPNRDTQDVVIGYYRSPLSGWVIGSSISQAALQAPLNASVKAFVGFGLVALALSLALALWFGRKVAVPLAGLARGAAALGRGEDVALPRGSVREIDDVSRALEQAAQELRAREAELLRVQQIGKVGGLEVDLRDGFRNKRSAEYLRLHGLAPDATRETHESWVARIHPDDRVETEKHFRDTVNSTNTNYTAEYRIVRPNDGEMRWIAAKAIIERDAQGLPLRLIGAHTDVTDIKEAEAALQRLNESLEAQVEERSAQISQLQKLEAIGQLTGGVAHDFNNLLTAIVGNLELLQRRVPDDPRLQRLIDNAMQGAHRGAALTQRLLAFARRQELRPEPVDVESLIEGMSDLLRRSLGPLIEIEMALPDHLSPAMVDANQLELAILNLAVNSRDAMAKGGRLRIRAREETYQSYGLGDLDDGAYVVIAVSDSGEGMDETTLRRATEPFFTTKGVGRGTGLGLSMVHGLAAQSGGALRLTSVEGEGTTAELWLPRAERAVASDIPPALPDANKPSTGRRVLIVDDDALVLTGTAAILDDMMHVVTEASSAQQALRILREGSQFDVVVTDHAMPVMTGAELAAEIARGWPDLPVVIATGYADLPEGFAPGIMRIAKPFGQQDLAHAIEAAIAARAQP